jgi:hypothetical protein
MPNFLSSIPSTTAQQVISTVYGRDSSVTNYQLGTALESLLRGGLATTAITMGTTGAISVYGGTPVETAISGVLNNTGFGALGQVLGFPGLNGGPISGQKPKALHTERAGSKAQGDQPYSETQDIEFFLLRADQPNPQSVTNAGQTNPLSSVTSQTGGLSFLGKDLQTPLGQLALSSAMNLATGITSSVVGRRLAPVVGPLIGLRVTQRLLNQGGDYSIFSQQSVENSGPTISSIANSINTGPDVVRRMENFPTYPANAQDYFFRLSDNSFNLGTTATVDPDPNSFRFTEGATSSLSTDLATRYPWVTSDRDLANTIASQSIPFSTAGAATFGRTYGEDSLAIQTNNQESLIPKSWYFITSPQGVGWGKEGKASTINTYGSNTPYVTYGSTSLRTLTLENIMLEGFSNRKTVEANIIALETCMNMVMNSVIGYVAPYCWKLFAGGKNYGTFIISNVKVKEVMRDTRGYATRATVDIELQQVPEFQVNSGRDLASRAMTAAIKSTVEAALGERQENQDRDSDTANRTPRPNTPSRRSNNNNNNNTPPPPRGPSSPPPENNSTATSVSPTINQTPSGSNNESFLDRRR